MLLDEVEKASPSLLNLFLQAFDEGWLTDGRGKRVYLSDAVIIMTSNLGSEHFRKLTSPMGFLSREVGVEQVQGEVMRELERRFSPEFRNRIDEVVLFAPLTHDEVREIAKHYLAQVTAGARQGRQDDSGRRRGARADRRRRATASAFGARFLKRVIDEQIKLPISERWKEGSHFEVVVRDGEVVVEPPRLVDREADRLRRRRLIGYHAKPAWCRLAAINGSELSCRPARLLRASPGRSGPAAPAPSPALPCGRPSGGYFCAYSRSNRGSIDGNSRSMNFMKCVRVPSCRYITLQPTKRAPWSAIALIVRSSFERDEEKPGTIGRHQHAGVDAGVDELADGAQPLQRVRGARFERPPRVLVDGRHAHVDRAAGGARQVAEHVAIADDHRSLRDEADRRSSARQRLERAARQPVVPFDRLIRIGRRAEGDVLARPRRPIELAREHLDEVALHENHRRELVVGVHLELHVVAAREAVVAAVRAAAIRIERPVERHALRRG